MGFVDVFRRLKETVDELESVGTKPGSLFIKAINSLYDSAAKSMMIGHGDHFEKGACLPWSKLRPTIGFCSQFLAIQDQWLLVYCRLLQDLWRNEQTVALSDPECRVTSAEMR